MKIPFDIKYRSQIESGKYKVETRNGLPVRIICWDKKSEKKYGYHIVGLIEYGLQHEESNYYTIDGKLRLKDKEPELFIITPELDLSEFEVRMREIRALYVAMQEQGVDDRYGDALSANLPRMIKWITDKIELAKREREFIKAVHTGQEELTPFENGVLKMIDDIAKCITYPNNSCIPNVRTVAAKLLELARNELEPEVLERLEAAYKNQDEVVYENGKRDGKAKALKDLPRWNESRGVYEKGWIYDKVLYYKNHSIPLSSLEKLPGFKED